MSSAATDTINEYEPLLLALQDVLGVVVPQGQRVNMLERIKPLLSTYKLDSFTSLAESLRDDSAADVRSNVLDVISQRESSWVISPDMKRLLHDYIFDQVPENASIWLVGCGKGQLAYAIAIEIAEFLNRSKANKKFQMVATDSNNEKIERANTATYNEAEMAGLSPDYRKLYSAKSGTDGSYQLKNRISELVRFEQCNLLEDIQSMGKMDLIICPDVLVYFSIETKKQILRQFSKVLNAGGVLMGTGNQVALPNNQFFERVDHPAGVFYRQLGK